MAERFHLYGIIAARLIWHPNAMVVETVVLAIAQAAKVFMENLHGPPLIQNWNRMTLVISGILDMLKNAVDEDNH